MRVLQKPRFDLAQLDTRATNLHLMIGAAEKVQAPFRVPAGEIARLVQPQLRKPISGIGGREETLVGQVRAIEIASRETVAGNEHLTDDRRGRWADVPC